MNNYENSIKTKFSKPFFSIGYYCASLIFFVLGVSDVDIHFGTLLKAENLKTKPVCCLPI